MRLNDEYEFVKDDGYYDYDGNETLNAFLKEIRNAIDSILDSAKKDPNEIIIRDVDGFYDRSFSSRLSYMKSEYEEDLKTLEINFSYSASVRLDTKFLALVFQYAADKIGQENIRVSDFDRKTCRIKFWFTLD